MSSRRHSEPSVSALPAGATPIGVDVGENPLFAVATPDTDPSDARTVSSVGVRDGLAALTETIRTLRTAELDADAVEAAVVASYWRRLRSMIDGAIQGVLEYARARPAPVAVLEDLGHNPPPLWALRAAELSQRGT